MNSFLDINYSNNIISYAPQFTDHRCMYTAQYSVSYSYTTVRV